jgi:hypothetical protein
VGKLSYGCIIKQICMGLDRPHSELWLRAMISDFEITCFVHAFGVIAAVSPHSHSKAPGAINKALID